MKTMFATDELLAPVRPGAPLRPLARLDRGGTGEVGVAVIGASGRIGRRLLQMLGRRDAPAAASPRARLVAVADSRRVLIARDGIDPAQAADQLAAQPAADVALAIDALAALPRPLIVVDCTASGAIAERYPAWLAAGVDVVTPNKRGPSADRALASRIAAGETIGGAQLYDATTVGAQLPLLAALRELRDAGDRVARFEAVLSGTLSYVLGRLQRGEALSTAVRGAVAEGYAEPHPAVDLSGEDAARKLVILLRALGHDVELADVERVPLVEAALLAEPDPQRLLLGLAAADETWRARVAVAEARRECWIYRASFERDPASLRVQARIAPERVPLGHPLAGLAPCENKLVLHSAFYAAAPLVVSGPGAGIDLTAAGVLGDLRLAARRRA
jgi:aspartokinase/homoserine dehydrogenase 1